MNNSDIKENINEQEEEKNLENMGYWESVKYQWRHVKITKIVIFRLVVIVVGFGVNISNNLIGFLYPKDDPKCLVDKLFNFLNPVNSYFSNHDASRKAMLIISSLFVDIYVLTTIFSYILFSKGYTFIITLFIEYILLIFIRQFFHNGIPKDFIFSYPGFPSLFVPYYITNNFFFSPTIGILTLCCIEWGRLNLFKIVMVSIGLVLLFLEIFIFASFRKSYICDFFTAVTLTHFLYLICEMFIDPIINRKILKKPLDVRDKIGSSNV